MALLPSSVTALPTVSPKSSPTEAPHAIHNDKNAPLDKNVNRSDKTTVTSFGSKSGGVGIKAGAVFGMVLAIGAIFVILLATFTLFAVAPVVVQVIFTVVLVSNGAASGPSSLNHVGSHFVVHT
jgi:hypothetical protein